MAWLRPSPKEILQRIQSIMDVDLPNGDSRIRRSSEGVFASVIAMATHEVLSFIAYIAKQILVSTADEEHIGRHARELNVPRKAANASTGPIRFTGANGTVVPAGRIVKRSDDQEYIVAGDITIAGGVGDGEVTALTLGAAGNVAAGAKLSLTSPVPGANSDGIVQAPGLTGGADIEDLEAWRARIIERKQRPPHGGAYYDYEFWAKEVPGVTRAWAYPNQYGLGTVGLAFVMDNKAGSIIPSPTEVEAVEVHIAAARPVTAEVHVLAPTPVAVDFTINISPNTVAVQNAIRAELADLFTRESIPGGKLYISRVREAISSAAGEFDHVLISPDENIERTFGQMSTLGAITFGGI